MRDTRKKMLQYIDSYYDSYYRINEVYYAWAAEHEIQDTTLFVLTEIFKEKDGCTQSLVSENLGYPKQTVSFIMNRLERDGIIIRTKSPEDKRNNIVRFTEKGRIYAEKLVAEMQNAEVEAYRGMTPEERETVTQGLRILAEALEGSFAKITRARQKGKGE